MNVNLVWQLVSLFKEMIVNAVGAEHRMPSCEDMKKLMDLSSKFVASGIVDLPDVDESEIAKRLNEMKDRVVCSIQVGEREMQHFGDIRADRYIPKTENA